MKYGFFFCLLSGIFGALATLFFLGHFPEKVAVAQSGLTSISADPLPPGLPYQQSVADPLVDQTAGKFTPEEVINIGVYDRNFKSVCNIDTTSQRGFRFMLNAPPIEGSGSGWVLDKQGHIVTNHHVIDGSDTITVTLFKEEPITAKVVGTDPQNDIAVLKINAPPEILHPVTLGESGSLRVGQRIFAIGSPFGLERTMTIGIVSSLERSIKSPKTNRMIKKIIQVDAALNQGNSGGPLLNSSGQVVGMNTAIASATGENTGVGFAIPINTIKRVVPQLIQLGQVRRPWLGIEVFWNAENGLGVVYPVENGPAAAAGIRGSKIERGVQRTGRGLEEVIRVDKSTSDIITAIEGKPVQNTDDLQDILDNLEPGQTIRINVLRNGQAIEVPLRLGIEDNR